jgi:hypothetical protein
LLSTYIDLTRKIDEGAIVMKALKAFVAVIIGLVTCHVLTNPLPDPFEDPPSGGTLAADKKESLIALKEELVEIDLSEKSAHVKGQYWLVNTSNEDLTIKIAFPDNSYLGPSDKSRIRNLKVVTDNKPQKTAFTKNKIHDRWSEGLSDLYEHIDFISSFHYWEMSFKPSQKRQVVIEYDSSTEYEWSYSDEKMDNQQRQFEYLLRTGSAWAGKIEKAEIRINLKDKASLIMIELKPKYASWQGDRISWVIKDFEPNIEYDIKIVYALNYKKNTKYSIESILDSVKNRSKLDKEALSDLAYSIRHLGTKEILELIPENDELRKWVDKKLEGVQ